MSHPVNNQIIDGLGERLFALEEVLKPSAHEALRGRLNDLIHDGDFYGCEQLLDEMEDAQDV